MRPSELLTRFNGALASYLARSVPVDLPRYRMDGVPISSAHDLAAAAQISITEARYRMKDLYGAQGEHSVPVGVGTVLERARMLSRPKRKRRRKKKTESDK